MADHENACDGLMFGGACLFVLLLCAGIQVRYSMAGSERPRRWVCRTKILEKVSVVRARASVRRAWS